MITARTRIGILACGVVSPLGVGWEPTWRALAAGASGVRPITLFEAEHLRGQRAGEIHDFDAHAYLEGKPLRGMSRSAHLTCTAVALALAERGDPAPGAGIVAGTAYGNVQSMVRFDRETFQEGPRFVDATLFPNTVINSPAGFASIFFQLTGPNTTLADGAASSFSAFEYAAGLLQRGDAPEVLAGGFEELSQWVVLGLHNGGRLAPAQAAPFDGRRSGIVPGEGAAFLRLASAEDVRRAGATPRAWMLGFGDATVPARIAAASAVDPALVRAAMARAMAAAIAAADLEPRAIDAVWASASGAAVLDACEAEALADVFGARLEALPVTAAKAALGESFGAGGALLVAGALGTLRDGLVPPTLGHEDAAAGAAPGGVRAQAQHVRARRVLVNAFQAPGRCASLVLERA